MPRRARPSGDRRSSGGASDRDQAPRTCEPRLTPRPARTNYSIRRPDIARAMTSCWISEVPSKIVWIKLSAFSGAVPYRTVPLTRQATRAQVWSVWCRLRPCHSEAGRSGRPGQPVVATDPRVRLHVAPDRTLGRPTLKIGPRVGFGSRLSRHCNRREHGSAPESVCGRFMLSLGHGCGCREAVLRTARRRVGAHRARPLTAPSTRRPGSHASPPDV